MRSELFAEIEKPLLERLLRSLYYCLGLPVSAFDERGATVLSFGDIHPFCAGLRSMIQKTGSKDFCVELKNKAALRSMKMGESFIFTCHAGLNNFVFPLCRDAAQYGCIMVGPFLVEPLGDGQLSDIAQLHSLKPAELLNLAHTAETLQVISSEKAGQIGPLLSAVFDPLISESPQDSSRQAGQEEGSSVTEDAVREFILKTHKNTNKIVQESVSYIAKNYNRQITLEDIAGHVGMNPSYISTLFKQSYDVSYREFFNMVRVEAAKALLRGTNDSILDISAVTGFEDQSYFTKVFKRYTGMTPKQYRTQKA